MWYSLATARACLPGFDMEVSAAFNPTNDLLALKPPRVAPTIEANVSSRDRPILEAEAATVPIPEDNSSTVVRPNFCAVKNLAAMFVASLASKPYATIDLTTAAVVVDTLALPATANLLAAVSTPVASAAPICADVISNKALVASFASIGISCMC